MPGRKSHHERSPVAGPASEQWIARVGKQTSRSPTPLLPTNAPDGQLPDSWLSGVVSRSGLPTIFSPAPALLPTSAPDNQLVIRWLPVNALLPFLGTVLRLNLAPQLGGVENGVEALAIIVLQWYVLKVYFIGLTWQQWLARSIIGAFAGIVVALLVLCSALALLAGVGRDLSQLANNGAFLFGVIVLTGLGISAAQVTLLKRYTIHPSYWILANLVASVVQYAMRLFLQGALGRGTTQELVVSSLLENTIYALVTGFTLFHILALASSRDASYSDAE